MEIIKIKTQSIAHLSYLVICGNEAAVIDPRRDCQKYLNILQNKGAQLKYIFETHRNEDFVTGSRELNRYTRAKILHGKGIEFKFGSSVDDGQTFDIGTTKLKTLETPGHTPESISIVVYPEGDLNQALGVFTGDALFVDDVGRTDFFPDKEKFAGKLYDSIHDRLLPLGDHVVLYPAHGAGSVCGGGISEREVSTLGFEKAHNPMLQLDREKFIKKKVNEKHQYPPYFKRMEDINLKGDDKPLQGYQTIDLLSAQELNENLNQYQVIDTREAESYLGCSIPNSISIPYGLAGAYLGYFLNFDEPICLVSDNYEDSNSYAVELKRLGFDNELYHLNGGISSWEVAGYSIQTIQTRSAEEVKAMVEQNEAPLLDIRKPDEWDSGVIDGADTVFLGDLPAQVKDFKDKPLVTYCGSGKRATIAASIIAKSGNKNVSVFLGSYLAWKNTGN